MSECVCARACEYLRERVLDVLRIRGGVGLLDPLEPSLDVQRGDRRHQLVRLAPKQLRGHADAFRVLESGVVFARTLEFSVAQMPGVHNGLVSEQIWMSKLGMMLTKSP